MFWHAATEGSSVDPAMVRYIRFVTDVCTWESGGLAKPREDLESVAPTVFGTQAGELAGQNIDLLQKASTHGSGKTYQPGSRVSFYRTASTQRQLPSPPPLPCLGASRRQPLCSLLPELRRKRAGQDFGWPEVLLLYATLLHRLHKTSDIHRRLRIVRNLVEGSANELRAQRIPALLKDVRRIIVEGKLSGISAFNQRIHVADEVAKLAFRRRTQNSKECCSSWRTTRCFGAV